MNAKTEITIDQAIVLVSTLPPFEKVVADWRLGQYEDTTVLLTDGCRIERSGWRFWLTGPTDNVTNLKKILREIPENDFFA